jgi:hypothetical protein
VAHAAHERDVTDGWAEDEIKAQLRELTENTRKLRQELEALISGPETPPSRRLLRQPGAAKDGELPGVGDPGTVRRKQ